MNTHPPPSDGNGERNDPILPPEISLKKLPKLVFPHLTLPFDIFLLVDLLPS